VLGYRSRSRLARSGSKTDSSPKKRGRIIGIGHAARPSENAVVACT
jgi:hypothetical protein